MVQIRSWDGIRSTYEGLPLTCGTDQLLVSELQNPDHWRNSDSDMVCHPLGVQHSLLPYPQNLQKVHLEFKEGKTTV